MTHTPEIVLFDWDNTLSDTFPALFDSYNHMLRHFGRDAWDETTAKQNIRRVAHEYLPTLFGDKWEEAREVYRAHYRSNHPTSPMFDGTQEVLEHLHGKGVKLGVISNKAQSLLDKAAEDSGFKPLLDVLIGAEEGRRGKPDPEAMDLALKQLNYDGAREKVWYVGDTDLDMEFAKNSGAKGVFIEHIGFDKKDDIKARFAPHGAYLNLRDFLASLD